MTSRGASSFRIRGLLSARSTHFGFSLAALALLANAGAVWAQTPPTQAQQSEQFQAHITEVARALGSNPRLKKMSLEQRENLVLFIAGNMLFVILHEMAHAAVDELNLSVLGREEDAADDFAVIRLLRVGSNFSHRVLEEAAKGWFYSDRRDRKDHEPLVFYDEHSLDKQRAYQIVCLMVGSDPAAFAELAKQTQLPEDRQETCKRDYEKVSKSWDSALKDHRRGSDQERTKIEVIYGDGKGEFDAFAHGFQSLRLLDVVAANAAEQLAWPHPFVLETQSCGFINARWMLETRRLTVCYELAQDFAQLFRDFNAPPQTNKRNQKNKKAAAGSAFVGKR